MATSSKKKYFEEIISAVHRLRFKGKKIEVVFIEVLIV